MSEEEQFPIKYVLLGDANSSKIITEYSSASASTKTKKEINQIYNKICKMPQKQYDQRNKIPSKGENYFFTTTKQNITFIVLVADTYPERLVFQLINQVSEEQIPTMTNDESKELTPNGRQSLKTLIDKYQDQKNFNKIAEIQEDVLTIKSDMKNNITKMVQSIDDVKNLEEKSDQLKTLTDDYKKNSVELRKITWWQNCKLWIIIGVIVAVIVIVVVVVVVVKNKK